MGLDHLTWDGDIKDLDSWRAGSFIAFKSGHNPGVDRIRHGFFSELAQSAICNREVQCYVVWLFRVHSSLINSRGKISNSLQPQSIIFF